MNSALITSVCISRIDENVIDAPRVRCPVWYPVVGLSPLEAYTRVLSCDLFQYSDPVSSIKIDQTIDLIQTPRLNCFKRVFSFCKAVWGLHSQISLTETMTDVPAFPKCNLYSKRESDGDELMESNHSEQMPEVITTADSSTHYLKTETLGQSDLSNTKLYKVYDVLNYPLNEYNEYFGIDALARKQAVSEWIR